MRFLYLDGDTNTGTWRLTRNFSDNELPFYAVLSHTWGADGDEVIFEDIQAGTRAFNDTSKTGFEKLRFCHEQAQKDGLRYLWCDTCCIRKSDAVEWYVSLM